MIEILLSFFGKYLIEIMTVMLVTGLTLRWISYRHSKRDEAYFSHFTRELAMTINHDKARNVHFNDVEDYLNDILGRVNKKLPERNLREITSKRKMREDENVTLKEYVGSKHGLINCIQNESAVFQNKVQPDFGQLTERVMNNDENWSKLFGTISIDGVSRILDVLPTLFIILGVFGTFIGISMALPEIARIDFNNLEASGQTLTQFVINVTFAMKTSIAGIFFSIILTLLNTLVPIEASRIGTFEKVENVLQLLWYHLQTDQSKTSTEKELSSIRETMEKVLVAIEGLGSNNQFKKAS